MRGIPGAERVDDLMLRDASPVKVARSLPGSLSVRDDSPDAPIPREDIRTAVSELTIEMLSLLKGLRVLSRDKILTMLASGDRRLSHLPLHARWGVLNRLRTARRREARESHSEDERAREAIWRNTGGKQDDEEESADDSWEDTKGEPSDAQAAGRTAREVIEKKLPELFPHTNTQRKILRAHLQRVQSGMSTGHGYIATLAADVGCDRETVRLYLATLDIRRDVIRQAFLENTTQ